MNEKKSEKSFAKLKSFAIFVVPKNEFSDKEIH